MEEAMEEPLEEALEKASEDLRGSVVLYVGAKMIVNV